MTTSSYRAFYGNPDEYGICPVCKMSVRLRRVGTLTGHIVPTQLDNAPCEGRGMRPLPAPRPARVEPVAPKQRRGGRRR